MKNIFNRFLNSLWFDNTASHEPELSAEPSFERRADTTKIEEKPVKQAVDKPEFDISYVPKPSETFMYAIIFVCGACVAFMGFIFGFCIGIFF